MGIKLVLVTERGPGPVLGLERHRQVQNVLSVDQKSARGSVT